MEENGDSLLDAIVDGEIGDDVDMVDAEAIEEGEIEEENQCVRSTEATDGDNNVAGREPGGKTRRRRARKKNKKKSGSVPNVDNINRFVIDTCRQLKERKSYLIWNAVGCLGVSAVRDLVKEVEEDSNPWTLVVGKDMEIHGLPMIWLCIGCKSHVDNDDNEDAIQACGGQMTADGKRPRNGGGILWNILKTREPKAFKEIMSKGKEFEKQFRQHNARRGSDENNKVIPSQKTVQASGDHFETEVSGCSEFMSQTLDGGEQRNADEKRISVLNRIRVPVAYDDLIGEDTKDETL
ncbi:hypothetical protein Scep_008185 [Stephania cephalantha]|uniref:Phosphorylated adapter RNA export protein n=1 Tax=Stephania cephalantha TaxID=152367 RepID=A0AAP0KB73_9MAGN